MNSDAALQRYLALTAIQGSSRHEAAVANWIVDDLLAAGLDRSAIAFDDAHHRIAAETGDPAGDTGNLIVTLPGTADGPRTLLSAHMDTVPICVGSKPVVRDGYVESEDPATGLGADDRGGCGAILTAIHARLRDPDAHPPAVVAFLVQEEIGLYGARHLDRAMIGDVDRAFNFDGGPPEEVTIGAIGGQRVDIVVHGHPAHAGVAPTRGASAIVMASNAIADLAADGWLGRVDRDGGVGTANIGVFRGGDATNVITPRVELRAEARSHDGPFRQRIIDHMRRAFETAADAVRTDDGRSGRVEWNDHVDYEAFRLPEDHPSVAAAMDALQTVGRTGECKITGGGLDANWLYVHGIQAVTLGCGQRNIHTADEQLDIEQYLDACRIAAALIR